MSKLENKNDTVTVKRKKQPHFTDTELKLLVRCVAEERSIIEDKRQDSDAWRNKADAWGRIVENFNARNGLFVHRTVENLHNKYKNIKKAFKAKKDRERQEYIETGGAQGITVHYTEAETLLDTFLPTAAGTHCNCDRIEGNSVTLEASTPVEFVPSAQPPPSPSPLEPLVAVVEEGDIDDLFSTVLKNSPSPPPPPVSVESDLCDDLIGRNWNKWAAPLAKTLVHPAKRTSNSPGRSDEAASAHSDADEATTSNEVGVENQCTSTTSTAIHPDNKKLKQNHRASLLKKISDYADHRMELTKMQVECVREQKEFLIERRAFLADQKEALRSQKQLQQEQLELARVQVQFYKKQIEAIDNNH